MSSICLFVLVFSCVPGVPGLILSMVKPDGSVDLTSLVNHVAALEQSLKSQETKSADLEFKVNLLTSDLASAKTESQKSKEEQERQAKELASAKEELVAMKMQLDMTSKEANVANSEVKRLKNEIMELKVNNTLNGQEIASAQQELTSMNMEVQLASNETNRTNSDVQKLKTEMMSLKMEVNSSLNNLDHDVDSNSADIHQLQQEVLKSQQLLMNNSSIRNELTSLQTELHVATARIVVLEANAAKGPKTKEVAFQACVATTYYNFAIVLFDTVEVNTGNGYSNKTGVFTAPLSGTYTFSAHAEPFWIGKTPESWSFAITKNDAALSKVNVKQDENKTFGCTSIVQLAKGDKVWVEADHMYLFGFKSTCFMGSILYVD